MHPETSDVSTGQLHAVHLGAGKHEKDPVILTEAGRDRLAMRP